MAKIKSSRALFYIPNRTHLSHIMFQHIFNSVFKRLRTARTPCTRTSHLDKHLSILLIKLYKTYIPAVFLHEWPHSSWDYFFYHLHRLTIIWIYRTIIFRRIKLLTKQCCSWVIIIWNLLSDAAFENIPVKALLLSNRNEVFTKKYSCDTIDLK